MRLFRLLLAPGTAAALVACGGGSTSSPIPGRTIATATPTAAAAQSIAQFVITWPQVAAKSGTRRKRAYLSNSTASVGITVNGGAEVSVDNPNLMPGATAPTQTTTFNVDAPAGSDTFKVTAYDATGAAAGGGHVLAQASVPYTIVEDRANVVPITLDGNLAKIGCAAVGPFVSGTTAMTMVGPAGQVQILPEDAKGNIIVAPGAVPQLALAPSDATQAKVTKASGTNVFNVNVLLTGTAITLEGSGVDLAGNGVSNATCAITRVEALYVANQSPYGSNAGSVTIYPATADGNTKPTATIGGSYTKQNEIQFVAVDSAGDVYVSNEGPMPGTPFGPTTGYVAIYSPAAYGNVAPIATVAGFSSPEGLAVDSKDSLYVLSQDRIQTFPSTANGLNGTTAVPSAVITGAATGLNSQYGLALGTDGTIFTAGVNDIVSTGQLQVFPAGATGNVAPITVNPPGATAANGSSQSWIGVAPDASGNVFTTAFNPTLDAVIGYTVPTTSGATNAPKYVGTGFAQPVGLFVDIFGNAPTGDIFVGNFGSNTIDSYTGTATLVAGVSNTALTGADTGLNVPFGIYVR